MCLVAFQKIFRKIFSDVWKRRRKRQTQEKYHQRLWSEIAISRSTAQARNGAISWSTRHEIAPLIAISVEGEIAINCAISRRRDLAKARSRSTLREIVPSIAISVEGEIAINCAISRRRDRDRRFVRSHCRSRSSLRSSDWSSRDRRRLELGVRRQSSDWLECFFSSHARALSLSLSLFPEMLWSENEGRKSFPGQRWKYWSTGSHFPENIIFRDNQTCGFGGKWFPEVISTQNKHSLKIVGAECMWRLVYSK